MQVAARAQSIGCAAAGRPHETGCAAVPRRAPLSCEQNHSPTAPHVTPPAGWACRPGAASTAGCRPARRLPTASWAPGRCHTGRTGGAGRAAAPGGRPGPAACRAPAPCGGRCSGLEQRRGWAGLSWEGGLLGEGWWHVVFGWGWLWTAASNVQCCRQPSPAPRGHQAADRGALRPALVGAPELRQRPQSCGGLVKSDKGQCGERWAGRQALERLRQ